MHNCLTGCIVKCSNVVHDREGKYKTSALEFETLALLGSNCGIDNWEDVADLDRLCDDVGLDTVETGAAIAIYMDAASTTYRRKLDRNNYLRRTQLYILSSIRRR